MTPHPWMQRALNAEHLHRKDDPDVSFTSHRLEQSLNRMLPSSEDMKNTQMVCPCSPGVTFSSHMNIYLVEHWSWCWSYFIQIFVPMVHHNHWVLYVVNRIMKCIHIIDSNTYGNEMNYTRWQDFHQQSVNISGKALRFSKLMMNRLTTAIQRVRPNSGFPKFGNWDFRFDYEAPRMKCGSNDCGFSWLNICSPSMANVD